MKFNYKGLIIKIQKNKFYKLFSLMILLFTIGVIMLALDIQDNRVENKGPYEEVKVKGISVNDNVSSNENVKEVEYRLKSILSQIEGVGELEVMVTMDNKGEIVLEKEHPSQKTLKKESDESGRDVEEKSEALDTRTVIISNSEGEQPIIIQEIYPDVRGVLVIAEGASNMKIQNDLINATKVLLDLPVHKIEVLEMKKKEKGYE